MYVFADSGLVGSLGIVHLFRDNRGRVTSDARQWVICGPWLSLVRRLVGTGTGPVRDFLQLMTHQSTLRLPYLYRVSVKSIDYLDMS